MHEPGRDYGATSAPVCRIGSEWVLLPIEFDWDWTVFKLNVMVAFVGKYLRTTYRSRQLKGETRELETSLLKVVFIATKSNPCVHTHHSGKTLVISILCMDDIMLTGRKAAQIKKAKLGLMVC